MLPISSYPYVALNEPSFAYPKVAILLDFDEQFLDTFQRDTYRRFCAT